MRKYVVFINGLFMDYEKYQKKAASDYGAIVFRPFDDRLTNMLFRLHFSWRLNAFFDLPFKSAWFEKCFDMGDIDADDEVCFIFYESFLMSYTRKFLTYLKDKCPRSEFVFVFTNPPGDNHNLERLGKVRSYYDLIITDVQSLAEIHGFDYYSLNPICYPDLRADEYDSDVFFVGFNKGRLETVLRFYEQLTAMGLKCDFHITGVKKKDQKYADKISYNSPIIYDEVLRRISGTRCILEVVQGDLDYYTFRVYESILYRKKLITTNIGIIHSDLYNPKYIAATKNPQEITAEFIDAIVDESEFPEKDLWSFERFAEHIEKRLKED